MRHETLVLTRAAVEKLEARFNVTKQAEAAVDNRHYDIVLLARTSPRSRPCCRKTAVVFKVAGTASKPEIKAAVEALFNVSVTGVNTIVQRARPSAGRGAPYKRSDVKKRS